MFVFSLLWLLLSECVRRFPSVFHYDGSMCSLDPAQSSFIGLIWSSKARGQNPRREKLFIWTCLWTSKRLIKRTPKLQELHGQSMKYKSFPVAKGQHYFSSLPPDDFSWSFIRLTELLLVLRVTGDTSELFILFLLGNRHFYSSHFHGPCQFWKIKQQFLFFHVSNHPFRPCFYIPPCLL